MLDRVAVLPLRDLSLAEAPTFVASLLIAEWLYTLHSFTLELAAFVVTWRLLAGLARWARGPGAS